MKRLAFMTLAVLMLAGCQDATRPEFEGLIAPPQFATLSGTEIQATTSANFESAPTLGDDGISSVVVYATFDLTTGSSGVEYQRITASGPLGGAVTLGDGMTDDRLNDVSGDLIVYTAFIPGTNLGQIRMHRISDGSTTNLSAVGSVGEAKIHGNNVAWIEGASNATMVMLGDATKANVTPKILAGPIPPAEQLEIGDIFVVWAQVA